MKLPEIGDIVTTEIARELCKYYGLDYLVSRIDADPCKYRDWEFDGCSGLIDQSLGFFTGCDWKKITYEACLPHDLGYAYGTPGDREEKKEVDDKFKLDLIEKAGMGKSMGGVFHWFVGKFGIEELGLSFSWAFATKKGDEL